MTGFELGVQARCLYKHVARIMSHPRLHVGKVLREEGLMYHSYVGIYVDIGSCVCIPTHS